MTRYRPESHCAKRAYFVQPSCRAAKGMCTGIPYRGTIVRSPYDSRGLEEVWWLPVLLVSLVSSGVAVGAILDTLTYPRRLGDQRMCA
jgi:hypothetical protein